MSTIPGLNPLTSVTGDDLLILHDTATGGTGKVDVNVVKDYIADSIALEGLLQAYDIPYSSSTVGQEIDRSLRYVDTFAQLSTTPGVIGQLVITKGHTVLGKGGGVFYAVSSSGRTPNMGTIAVSGSIAWIRAKNGGQGFSVYDFGAMGDGVTDDSTAFNAANASGENIVCPIGDFRIANPTTLRNFKGAGRYSNQTHIILTDAGQLLPGDAYSTWSGFSVSTSVSGKTMIKNQGMSYFTFTDFSLYKTGGAGQVGIHFDLTSADIYFNNIDNFSIVCDYPVNITGDIDGSPSVRAFNSNVLGQGVAGNKWFQFQSAITIDMGTGVCDANQFSGYFESGINIINLSSGSATPFKQNRVKVVQDAVTRVLNTAISIPNQNIWEVLDTGIFTYGGVKPQNQIYIGPPNTKVRATDTSSTPILVSGTEHTMTFDMETFDTLGEFSGGTGIFTAKEAGYYSVNCSALTQSYTWPINTKFEMRLYKNSTLYRVDKQLSETASVANIPFSCKINEVVYLNGDTDTLTVKLIQNRGANTSLDSDPTFNCINITRA